MARAAKALAVMTAASLLLMVAATGAFAQIVEGSSSDAYGLHVRADLFDTNFINQTFPSVKAPDANQANPNSSSTSLLGQDIRIPSDTGQLVSEIPLLKVKASRTTGDLRTASSEAHTTHVFLFEQDGVPQVKVDFVDAVASAKCTGPDKASVGTDGSRLIGLELGGQPVIDETPDPNTTIPLQYTGDPSTVNDDMALKIILNEQTGADKGTGVTVNMIHIIGYALSNPGLAYVDLVIAHASASVFCGEATPPSDENDGGAGGPVVIDKIVTTTTSDAAGAVDGTEATAHRGDNVTWKITITNKGQNACGIVTVNDTLPMPFTFVSATGDLSTGATPMNNGQDVTWDNPRKYNLGPGASLNESITAKVADDAPFGTYVNLVNVTGTCSEYSQGLRGPVTIVDATSVKGVRKTAPLPATEVNGELARTGAADVATMLVGMLLLVSAGVGMRALKRNS